MGADHSALVVLPIGRGVPAAGAEDTAGLEADQGGRGAKAARHSLLSESDGDGGVDLLAGRVDGTVAALDKVCGPDDIT